LTNEGLNAKETIRPTYQIKKQAPKCGVTKHRTFNVVPTAMVVQHQTAHMANQD
jgi:hypothetical protein